MNKPPTMADVARVAGVSRSAVSKVLRNAYGVSDELRSKVERAVEETGYRPNVSARGLRGATYTVGVSTPPLAENDFPAIVIDAVVGHFARHSYDVIVLPNREQGDVEGLRRLRDRQTDGIIVIGTTASTKALEDIAATTPLVAVGRHDDSSVFDSVCSDDERGAARLLEHLHGLGHRRIAFLGMPRLQYDASGRLDSNEVRLRSYESWMRGHGLDPMTVRTSFADAGETVDALIRRHPDVTAIVAANDSLGLATMAATGSGDLAARRISVTGFDGIPIAAYPAIDMTTMDQHGSMLGQKAAELLLERIGGRTEAMHLTIAPTLCARSSTTRPESD